MVEFISHFFNSDRIRLGRESQRVDVVSRESSVSQAGHRSQHSAHRSGSQ
jgi:hypothetical protein